jgi:hypothetical protein
MPRYSPLVTGGLHDLGACLGYGWTLAANERLGMSTKDTYLAVFLSNKTSPSWRAWYAMSEEERRAKDVVGLAALKAWDEKHRDSIVYTGGPLGPTKRTSRNGIADVVNELTVFVVVRASSHEEAAKLFEGHPHMTIFPCDAVDVMPLLSGPDA